MKPGSELALIDGLTRAALDAGRSAGSAARGQRRARGAQAVAGGATAAAERARRPAFPRRRSPRRRSACARRRARRSCSAGRSPSIPQAPALLQAVENLAWVTGAITARALVASCTWARRTTRQGALDMGLTPDCLPGYVPVADAAGARAVRAGSGAQLLGMGAGHERARDPRGARPTVASRRCGSWATIGCRSAPDRALAEQALAQSRARDRQRAVPRPRPRNARTSSSRPTPSPRRRAWCVNSERRLQKSVRALAWRKRHASPTGRSSRRWRSALGAPLELPQRRGHLPRDREARCPATAA